ncbi:hypothetical protein CENSYa_0320 [Cenarchaeum symbiosum A]|uniref:Intracellular proteinase inhibitor BsuPI domain-containing protein n=1 Tax=Cenarchaeum symbiosum (strain A) TaxID=414004 RepID=A0RUD9_CENSY|nr:hypothetical protein CENSYa_0320 [Cenarchaeum symbiosum A]
MMPAGLVLAVCVGAAAGGIAGALLVDTGGGPLVFVEGPSLSVLADKQGFGRGEEILIRIINTGSVPLEFDDSSYGVRVVQLDGIELYAPESSGGERTMGPGEEAALVWDQIKSDGDAALHGTYKIIATAVSGELEVEGTATVNIF